MRQRWCARHNATAGVDHDHARICVDLVEIHDWVGLRRTIRRLMRISGDTDLPTWRVRRSMLRWMPIRDGHERRCLDCRDEPPVCAVTVAARRAASRGSPADLAHHTLLTVDAPAHYGAMMDWGRGWKLPVLVTAHEEHTAIQSITPTRLRAAGPAKGWRSDAARAG